jgi:hypothetical protein
MEESRFVEDNLDWLDLDGEEPRVASGKHSLAQLRVTSVAKKRAASFAGKVLSAMKRVKRALNKKLLTYAASTGHQMTVEHEVSKAFGELERAATPMIEGELRKTMMDGGDAAARSIHLHGVPLGKK